MKKFKYAIHPGYIQSINDRQMHYIGIADLVRLYELKQGEYIVWNERIRGYDWDDFIHLYPNQEGNYGRPEERT